MRRDRFTEDQIIGVLREHEAGMKAGSTALAKLPRQGPPKRPLASNHRLNGAIPVSTTMVIDAA